MVLICRTCAVFLVLIFSVGIKTCASQYNRHWSDKYDESNRCPKLYPKNFVSYVPFGNLTAGNYTEKLGLKGLRQCVMACCISDPCNVAFIFNSRCYHVECVSNELCVPLRRSGRGKWDAHVSMILVKPVLPNENWQDILDQSGSAIQSTNKQQLESSSNFLSEDDIYPSYTSHTRNNMLNDDDESNLLSQFLNNLPNIEDDDLPRTFDNDNDVIVDTSTFFDKSLEIPCEVGAQDECPFHSECVPLGLKTRNGFCKCMPGTEENAQGACVQTIRPYSKGPTDLDSLKKNSELSLDLKSDFQSETSSLGSVQNLTVSIFSKEVQLPENEVTLAAYTIPDEKATKSHYSYSWTLVDQPKESFTGNMNQNGATVTLTDLTEGQYRFKVTVNATNAYGEGFANVTVHPPKRTNKPPQVVITPQAQTVKLPNTGAVLDGSASKDDDAIISWHWELTSGPIGYQPPLKDGPTLVLNDLKQPGNYTFKLTVEDSDHVKNSTSANITVLNHTDYPPEANAGQDVIIYLPNNNLTLNGSLSTDDHEITSWEWTKAAEDENKAVDMQNTHSPYLQLSNLSEGVYTFVLKVTDSSGQSSTAEVRVFVKPPTNTPPVANAGPDLFISLPQTWVILNGSTSQDDHRIVAYTWRCVSGPNNASVLRHNESVANATGLTKGVYEFSLSVLDDSGNTATDDVTVTVAQNKNSPPKADAGGDLVLSLPVPVLLLNGSRSSDDFRIVSWQWTRSPSGLAAGTVIMDSHTKPVLMLTNIEAGRYVFELTVTDDQGASSRDAVSVQVKPDPLETSQLEVTLNVPVAAFTRSQLDSLLQKLVLLLKEDIRVNVTEIRGERDTGNVQLVFFLWDQNKAVEGLRALSLVNSARHAGLSDIVSRVRSVRCLSTCSGRGTCDQATRACRCPPAWMQSLLSQLQSDAQPDCAWSVVYFSLSGVLVLCGTCGACTLMARALRRAPAPRAPRPRPSYRLLPVADSEDKPFTKDLSESETDSDVLFESKSKTTSFGSRLLNGDAPQSHSSWKKNGHYKSSRKVKT